MQLRAWLIITLFESHCLCGIKQVYFFLKKKQLKKVVESS
jgi:hypothetical protein